MKKKLLLLSSIALLATTTLSAQCPTVTCPGDITLNNDLGTCGAVVNYTTPVGTDLCSSNLSNILFVVDGVNGTASEIPAVLTAAGHTVTSVYDDYIGGDNTVLQGSLNQYDVIFWHASGDAGYGAAHNAATFTNLSSYITNGGAVFVTGYDVIASPTDPELITFLGGTSSSDGGFDGTETVVGTNSLTTGVTNIIGLNLTTTGDHDGLNGLQPGTVGVATTGTSHGWTIRTLGAGEIALVSSTNYVTNAYPAWSTSGSGYNEALLNFAFNHASSPVTSMTAGLADGSIFPVGSTTVTYEVVDYLGNNPQSCSFIVTVVDNETLIADVSSLPPLTEECSITPTTPTATDNCLGTISGTTTTTFPMIASGTITWTYDDGNGNVITQNQTVTVTDQTAPVADATTLADVTETCEVATLTAPTATDNCATTITVTNNATFPITTIGTTIVTWTYDDGNGNTSTQMQNVIVQDPMIDVTTTDANFVISANNTTATTYQWIDCNNNNVAIAGETNSSYTATANGDYAVIITEGNCSDTSACVTIAGVGIDEVGLLSVVEIYPNPNKGEFTINTTLTNATVSIYGLDGKLILSNIKITQSNQKINLENVENGVYFVTVKNKVNQKTIKLIIQ